MRGEYYNETTNLAIKLCSVLLENVGVFSTREEAAVELEKTLVSGSAALKFEEMVYNQGGDIRVVKDPYKYLPHAKNTSAILLSGIEDKSCKKCLGIL